MFAQAGEAKLSHRAKPQVMVKMDPSGRVGCWLAGADKDGHGAPGGKGCVKVGGRGSTTCRVPETSPGGHLPGEAFLAAGA